MQWLQSAAFLSAPSRRWGTTIPSRGETCAPAGASAIGQARVLKFVSQKIFFVFSFSQIFFLRFRIPFSLCHLSMFLKLFINYSALTRSGRYISIP